MPYVHNYEVARLIKTEYKLSDLERIVSLLRDRPTFDFPALDNGLFPAAIVSDSTQYTGYAAVWVRDNIYVAHAHYLWGEVETALKCVRCLMQYFRQHQDRFKKIIDGEVNIDNVMQRPHVRFIGEEYQGKEFTGKQLCIDKGINIHYNKRQHSFSTSGLRKRIKEV